LLQLSSGVYLHRSYRRPSSLSVLRPPPRPPLFPYTTLFRSLGPLVDAEYGSATFVPAGAGPATYELRVSTTGLLMRRATPHQQRSEEHTSELQSRGHLVCRLLLEKKKTEQLVEMVKASNLRG